MTRVLIAYTTRNGHTEKIACRMEQLLRTEGHEVLRLDMAKPAADLDPSSWQVALVGAPLYAIGYPKSATKFVRKHRDWLNRVPSAFFSVGLAIASKTHDGKAQTQPIVDQFLRRTGWHPSRVQFIAGALPYSRYGLLTRLVMRRIARQEGGDTDTSRDYEYTDWEAVERFVTEASTQGHRATNSAIEYSPRAATPGV